MYTGNILPFLQQRLHPPDGAVRYFLCFSVEHIGYGCSAQSEFPGYITDSDSFFFHGHPPLVLQGKSGYANHNKFRKELKLFSNAGGLIIRKGKGRQGIVT